MPKEDKPLPKPPHKPFGRKRGGDSKKGEDLIADRMGMAMAKGEMESFVERELGGNENAARLASMMMGMTGMGQAFAPPPDGNKSSETDAGERDPAQDIKGITPPEEIMKATMSGDVKKLTELLKAASAQGHQEQSEQASGGKQTSANSSESPKDPAVGGDAFMEKQMLDKLIRMASENNVTVDWLIQRAIKLYLQDYEKSGRM